MIKLFLLAFGIGILVGLSIGYLIVRMKLKREIEELSVEILRGMYKFKS